MKRLPAQTKKFLEETAEYIKDEVLGSNADFRKKLYRIHNHFKSHYNYGFEEGIIQGTLIRYPDEIKRFMNCYEAGIFLYLLLQELEFKPKLRLLEVIESHHPYGRGVNYDHAIIELSDGEKKYYYDPLGPLQVIKKEEGNEIQLEDTTIRYKSSTDFTSLDEVIEKTEFLRSPEGQVQTLTQEYRVKSASLFTGLADLSSSIYYDKETNKFYTENNICYQICNNKRITIIDDLVKDKSAVSFKITPNTNFDVAPEVIRIDKELLDEVYELFNFGRTAREAKYCPDLQISQLVNNEDLDILSKESGVSEEVLKDISTRLNNVIQKYVQEFDKGSKFCKGFKTLLREKNRYYKWLEGLFKMREYLINARHIRGRKNYESLYTKEEINNYYNKSFNKLLEERKEFLDLESEIQRELVSAVNSPHQGDDCLTDLNPELGERLKEMRSKRIEEYLIKQKFSDALRNLRLVDSEYFYILSDAYIVWDKLKRVDNKHLEKIVYEFNGFLGYKQVVADLISLYMFIKDFVEIKYHKKKLFPIIKKYLEAKK